MVLRDSAISTDRDTARPRATGLGWGFVGVAAFSFTVPLTRVAVEDAAMSPLFVGAGRAVVAAALAAVALGVTRQRLPRGTQWVRVAVVAAGVVVGFPLLTSYALTTTPASHGAVVIALLPAATAITVVLRTRESPPAAFWVSSILGMGVAVAFAAVQGGGFSELHRGDLLLFGAVIAAAVGYAEGGLLAQEIGAWQTVSWALLVASPVMVAATAFAVVDHPPSGNPAQWSAFAYLSLVSMYLGFFAWYRGLAIGPMAQVSQIQLTQPVMSICWAALFLHEELTVTTVIGGIAVIGCAAAAVRVRMSAQRQSA
jgi:drug/metabolite transporter (DMT)-like permease